MSQDNNSEWLSPEQFAKVLGVSPRTVREWCRRRKVGAVLIGHTWRVPRSSLERLEERAAAIVDCALPPYPDQAATKLK
jgi:excisionase family DNA binding protein